MLAGAERLELVEADLLGGPGYALRSALQQSEEARQLAEEEPLAHDEVHEPRREERLRLREHLVRDRRERAAAVEHERGPAADARCRRDAAGVARPAPGLLRTRCVPAADDVAAARTPVDGAADVGGDMKSNDEFRGDDCPWFCVFF